MTLDKETEIIKYSLRVNKKIYEKFKYVADDNFRTVNKELEKLMTTHIAQYEEKNGKIKISED